MAVASTTNNAAAIRAFRFRARLDRERPGLSWGCSTTPASLSKRVIRALRASPLRASRTLGPESLEQGFGNFAMFERQTVPERFRQPEVFQQTLPGLVSLSTLGVEHSEPQEDRLRLG